MFEGGRMNVAVTERLLNVIQNRQQRTLEPRLTATDRITNAVLVTALILTTWALLRTT